LFLPSGNRNINVCAHCGSGRHMSNMCFICILNQRCVRIMLIIQRVIDTLLVLTLTKLKASTQLIHMEDPNCFIRDARFVTMFLQDHVSSNGGSMKGPIRYPPLYALYYKHIATLFPLPETHSLSRKFFSTYNSNSCIAVYCLFDLRECVCVCVCVNFSLIVIYIFMRQAKYMNYIHLSREQ
jgi:hypothetical protein